MNQLQSESGLVQTNLVDGNISLAEEHAARAARLLDSRDPVNNVTWKEEIAERNQRIAEELVSAVSALEKMNMSMSAPSSLYGQRIQSISNIDTKAGKYIIEIPVYAILFNPIRPESTNFTIDIK
jgi:roadblock/LC7 domain-containing protein